MSLLVVHALVRIDVKKYFQQAAEVIMKHWWMLQCRRCSIECWQRYLEAVVFLAACFAPQHRPFHRKHLAKQYVQFRKFESLHCKPSTRHELVGQGHDFKHH